METMKLEICNEKLVSAILKRICFYKKEEGRKEKEVMNPSCASS